MTKKQDRNTQKPLNDEEIGNPPEKEFRVMIVKMTQDLGKRMETQIDNLKEMTDKELEDLKSKMKSTIAEMKNDLEWTNSRLTEAEERISEVEDRVVEITATEKNKEKRMKKTEESLRDIWDNIKHTNIHTVGVLVREEREKKCQRKYLKIL